MRILCSARDPGAVGSISAISDALRKDPRFECEVVASGAALNMLRQSDRPVLEFALAGGGDHVRGDDDPGELLEAASELIARTRPDAILASLSSYGAGIDEALLATSGVPTFALQEFWGDVNLTLKTPAGVYLVLDDYAASVTRQRWGVCALVVGSPKYSMYSSLDVAALRSDARRSIGASENEKVVGFFAQTSEIPGHEEGFRELVDAVAMMAHRPTLLLRQHPKFQQSPEDHLKLAESSGITVADVTGRGNVEAWLAACDVVVTCFSICALDHAYLSAVSQAQIGSVVYLMTNEMLRDSMRRYCGMDQFPMVDEGMGLVARSPGELVRSLETALRADTAASYSTAAKALHSGDPCQSIIEILLDRVPGGPNGS